MAKTDFFSSRSGLYKARLRLQTTIVNNRNEKNPQSDIVFRNVSKAFDKVWHTGLKFKIITLDIHNCFKKILCNFLDNRKALTKSKNTLVLHTLLHSGVPRGAGLSPTLYAFYIHDLPPPSPFSEHIAYADDITQIISYNSKSHRMLNSKRKQLSKM